MYPPYLFISIQSRCVNKYDLRFSIIRREVPYPFIYKKFPDTYAVSGIKTDKEVGASECIRGVLLRDVPQESQIP